jgi:hypothetical protein
MFQPTWPSSGNTKAAPEWGGAAGLQPPAPKTPQNQKLKNTDFVDTMIWNVLCDLPFSRNQPLKLVDD